MKKFTISTLSAGLMIFAAVAVMNLTSCNPDPCKEETCNDHGTPTEVDKKTCECECGTGYEGEKCETKMTAKFIGSYTVTDGCTSVGTYSVSVSSSSSTVDKILITNFGLYGCSGSWPTIEATVDGNDITIESQSFCSAGDVFTVSGTGTMNSSGSTITLTYSGVRPTSDGGGSYSCNVSMAKL